MKYGYCRISTKKQNIERQIRNIKTAYPDALILTEEYTGTKMTRPEWVKLEKRVRKGEMIIFDSVSRMSRNAEEGFLLYERLFQNGISLVFLKEPQINTETYKKARDGSVGMTNTLADYILEGVNKYLLALAKEQIRLAFEQSEKEVEDLHQRTREGIETARLNGKRIGLAKGTKLVTKKSIKAKEVIAKHSKTFGGTLTDDECRKVAGVSRNSYYKYKTELKKERSTNSIV